MKASDNHGPVRPARRRWLRHSGRAALAGVLPGSLLSRLAMGQSDGPGASAAGREPLPESPGTSGPVALDAEFAPVVAGEAIVFPRDHGAHPAYRTEWWYLTAWLDTPDGPLGLQLTFFRSRTAYGRGNPSRFAPRQLVLAHAALADPSQQALRHADLAFRANPVSARYSTADADLLIGLAGSRWQFVRDDAGRYQMSVQAADFSFSMTAQPSVHFPQPVLQGEQGFSRKGPEPQQASYYYSHPQLELNGEVRLDGSARAVSGTGWLDHEWSSEIMDQRAAGWDWVGLNFDNGDALMAFRMRRKDGGILHSTARLWHSATDTGSAPQATDPAVQFSVRRTWRSALTGADYPVSLRIVAGERDITLVPLFDDQELDTRGSTGIIYWEGAVRVHVTAADGEPGAPVGRGYLELTGYASEVNL